MCIRDRPPGVVGTACRAGAPPADVDGAPLVGVLGMPLGAAALGAPPELLGIAGGCAAVGVDGGIAPPNGAYGWCDDMPCNGWLVLCGSATGAMGNGHDAPPGNALYPCASWIVPCGTL